MGQQKSISVAMCTYNGEKYLRQQLESIAGQSRPPIELVIIDDRSKDSTLEIAREFAGTAPFQVHVLVNETNVGASSRGITKNFEQAVSRCSGDLIVPCDQDDVWLPEKLAVLAGMMESDPGLGGVFSDARLITAEGEPKGTLLSQATGLNSGDQKRLARWDALPVLLAMNKIYGSSLMFDRRLLAKIVPIPSSWWFDAWVGTMAAVHARLGYTSTPLFLYRIHANQNHGASVASTSERVKQWKRSAKDYWEDAAPKLSDLHQRMAEDNDPRLEPYMTYVQGRMDLLRRRAELSGSRVRRMGEVLREGRNYHRYFNGWRSIVKDLTA